MATINPIAVEPTEITSRKSTSTFPQLSCFISSALPRRNSGSEPVVKRPSKRRTQTSSIWFSSMVITINPAMARPPWGLWYRTTLDGRS